MTMSKYRKDMDERIVNACNELIQLQANGAKQRATRDNELREVIRCLDQVTKQWDEKIKPQKIMDHRYSQAVLSVFGEGNENDDDGNQDRKSMSPFLVQRLSQLCYHIHLMTTIEEMVKRIHQDNVVVINWLHERWESMERESNEMKGKIEMLKRQTGCQIHERLFNDAVEEKKSNEIENENDNFNGELRQNLS